MIKIKKEGILISKTDFEFENGAVLNPAIIREGDSVHIFYRAVQEGNYWLTLFFWGLSEKFIKSE